MLPQLDLGQYIALVSALVLVGAAKTGFSGLGVVAVALFALALPARESTGALLPLLLLGDLLAVAVYRRHAQWRHLARLFPWVGVGVVLGAALVGRVDDGQMRRLIGASLLLVLAAAVLRRRLEQSVVRRAPPTAAPGARPGRSVLAAAVGVAAGFLTMLANAAGPLLSVYLLAAGLPVLAFLGTSAWFFLVVNAFKLPFSAGLGLITLESLGLLALAPAVVAGAALGRFLVARVDQALFERVTLSLVLLAALRLLV